MKFIIMCIFTFGAAYAGISIVHAFGWADWTYHVVVISTGVVLYFISNFLVISFIRRRAPDFASKEEVFPSIQKWELTAGTGIVPKWVTFIGIAGTAFILASPFELIAWLIRTIQK